MRSMTEKPPIARPARTTEVDHQTLFDAPPPWQDYWWEMPEYIMEDCRPYVSITVHFSNWDDVEKFADRIEQTITRNTKSVWFGEQTVEAAKDWCYE